MAIKRALEDLDVAVLCGGPGAEREVSLLSGEAVTQGLSEAGINAHKIDVSGKHEQILGLKCDIAFLALHGEFGEDGTVQAFLEKAGIPYTGSGTLCCADTLDKNIAKLKVKEAGFATADWVCAGSASALLAKIHAMGMECPLVVKPVSRGSSVGVTIVRSPDQLDEAMQKAFEVDDVVMAEVFIDGRELTVGILDGNAMPVIEMKPAREFYDYTAKYTDCGTEYICPAKLEPEISKKLAENAEDIFRTLGCRDFSRIDYILDNSGSVYFLEVNTIPGFTSHSLVPMAARETGLEFPQLCRKILELAWNDRGDSEVRTDGKA